MQVWFRLGLCEDSDPSLHSLDLLTDAKTTEVTVTVYSSPYSCHIISVSIILTVRSRHSAATGTQSISNTALCYWVQPQRSNGWDGYIRQRTLISSHYDTWLFNG